MARVALRGSLAAMVVAASCSSRQAPDSAARLFAVHNALRAMGLTEMGAINQGVLREGQEARFPLTLPAACVTVMAFGGGGAKDVELSVLDAEGKTVALDDTRDAQAVVRTCVDRPGTYTAVVRMAAGNGDYLVSSWTGGDKPPFGEAATSSLSLGGSCDNPTPIVAGETYAGNTESGREDHEGSCGNTSNGGGKELVFRLEVPARERVTIEVSAQFDSVLYLRKGDCADDSAEVACNDDSSGGTKGSRIDTVLDPGSYYVFVDGYGDDTGPFRLQVNAHEAPSLRDTCRGARPLSASARLGGRIEDAFDNVHASCGRGAKGADAVYRFDLPTRARVRLVETSGDFRSVLHLRRTCEDETSELFCSDGGLTDDEASWVGSLDAGTYWAFADGADEGAAGAFTMHAETAAEAGGGAPGDVCGDAIPLSASSGRVDGDTFEARDDLVVSCGAPSTPDVVYRFDLARRSRISAKILRDEAKHVLALAHSCGDKSTELGCGTAIDRLVGPGTYFLAVDAEREGSMGRFTLAYRIRDLEAIERACAKAPALVLGRPLSGTTVGAGDKFSPSCPGHSSGHAADRVYRFQVPRRMTLRATVTAQGFPAALSVRRTCADDATEFKCNEASDPSGQAQMQLVLDAGVYYAIVDGASPRGEGAYTILLEEVR